MYIDFEGRKALKEELKEFDGASATVGAEPAETEANRRKEIQTFIS